MVKCKCSRSFSPTQGVTYVAVTRLHPGRGSDLLTEFADKNDLIQGLLTSCHIPVYFDKGKPVRRYRGGWYCDGGLTNFIPVPGMLTVQQHSFMSTCSLYPVFASSAGSVHYH